VGLHAGEALAQARQLLLELGETLVRGLVGLLAQRGPLDRSPEATVNESTKKSKKSK